MTAECPSGKRRHPDCQAALTELRRAHRAARHGRKTPRQIYRCELCHGGWHTTSMSRAQWLMWPRRRPTT